MTSSVEPAIVDDARPSDRRIAGLDRRTVAPGLAVLALAAGMTLVLPAIDRAMEYDLHVETGDTITLASVSFDPAAGWGQITGEGAAALDNVDAPAAERAVVGEGTSRFSVTTYDLDATADELLDLAESLDPDLDDVRGFHVTGKPSSYTTTAGVTGVVERFTGIDTEGFVATFADGGVGVIVVVAAGEDQLREHTTEINGMLDSIRLAPADDTTRSGST